MPRQLDLIKKPDLVVVPEAGQTEPRFWVRRLVIWQEPGKVLRDIPLRPGLNIVWSPDGIDPSEPDGVATIGHGSGKTLFCRLLRYCLGEDRFAPKEQRDLIGETFINGIVGAEVILNGNCWAIVRSLGANKMHDAVLNGDLDALASSQSQSTKIDAFLDAVESSIITSAVSSLIPKLKEGQRGWPIALAWLTRDQECRFNDVLGWRSSESDSDSLVRSFSASETLDALRAFLKAITAEENALRAEIASLSEEKRAVEQESNHKAWAAEKAKARLIKELKLPDGVVADGDMAIDVLRKAAEDKLAEAAKVPSGNEPTDIDAARSELDAAEDEKRKLSEELVSIDAQVPIIQRLISNIDGEVSALSYREVEAKSAVCTSGDPSVDKILSENCKRLRNAPSAADIEKERQAKEGDLTKEKELLSGLKVRLNEIKPLQAVAIQKYERIRSRLFSLEASRDARETQWYIARRLLDDAVRFGDWQQQHNEAVETVRGLTKTLDDKREKANLLRDKQAKVFYSLTEKFDPIVRRLLGGEAEGKVILDGKGLHVTINKGGNRSTAAIDSLKVLSFDISALCLSIEGKTCAPAFLLHDSPREADLGESIYHGLFRLIRSLEDVNGSPLFQYIVTTTSNPPAEFQKAPWVCLKLMGTPAEGRLLQRDL